MRAKVLEVARRNGDSCKTMRNRSQDRIIYIGSPGNTRVYGQRGTWFVEIVDATGVWVDAETGKHHETKELAVWAAKTLAIASGGRYQKR